MAARTAEIESGHRHRILRGTRDGPQHHELVERQLAVVPVAAADTELALDVDRQQQFRRDDVTAQPRYVSLEYGQCALEEPVPGRVGVRPGIERRVLDYGRQHVT